MAAGKLRHPSIPRRTAFRVAVQHEDRARFAPWVGEVVDHIVKIEIWWNAQCGHSACPFRFSDDRCARTLPPSCAQVHLRSMAVPPCHHWHRARPASVLALVTSRGCPYGKTVSLHWRSQWPTLVPPQPGYNQSEIPHGEADDRPYPPCRIERSGPVGDRGVL